MTESLFKYLDANLVPMAENISLIKTELSRYNENIHTLDKKICLLEQSQLQEKRDREYSVFIATSLSVISLAFSILIAGFKHLWEFLSQILAVVK